MQIKTTTDQIADAIRDAIFSGKFQPGSRLKESDIASWLSVSRTPVREALRKLEAEGLADFVPNKGVIVPLLDDQDIDEICELRILIELYCVRKFLRIATKENFREMEALLEEMKSAVSNNKIPLYFALSLDFHNYIILHCQNQRLFYFFNSIRNTMRSAQAMLRENSSFVHNSIEEHSELLELLKKRSKDCEKVLRLHIESACERMRENIKKARESQNEGLIAFQR